MSEIPEEIKAIGAAIQQSKQELQRIFASGNVEAIKQKVEDVREVIKRLPEPFRSIETVQTLMNLSMAFLQTGRIQDAFEYSEDGTRIAEALVEQLPDQPQPQDLLSGVLSAKANLLMTVGKFDLAEECAKRAYALAERIFNKNDVRLTKSLRNLGVILGRKGEQAEGEKHLLRAYTIVCLASGAQSPEAQMLTEDLVNMFLAKEDLESAEKYARSNFKKVSELATKSPRDELILADSASRLGSLLVKRGNFEEAEGLIAQALSLRENSQADNFNPIGVAYSLAQLAGIQEESGKITAKTEEMLIRAVDIFATAKGQQSPEVANSLNQLRSVRMKRAAERAKNGGNADADEGTTRVVSENRSVLNGGDSSPLRSDPFGLSDLDRKKMAALGAEDGESRLMLAQAYFQSSKFLAASILLTEAHDLFLKQEGPGGEKTKMAKQNMMVSHMKRIDQLWLSAAREELMQLEDELSKQTVSASVADDSGFASDDEEPQQPVKKTAASKLKAPATAASHENKKNKLTPEEELFLRSLDTAPKVQASTCVIS